MRLEDVKEIPKKRASRHNLQDMIRNFMDSESTVVKLVLGEHEYKSCSVCCNCVGVAVKRSGCPIKVYQRDGSVYMKKIAVSMEEP